jgi:hypothetical protein
VVPLGKKLSFNSAEIRANCSVLFFPFLLKIRINNPTKKIGKTMPIIVNINSSFIKMTF